MENGKNNRGMSFEELRRQKAGQGTGNVRDGGELFETDWEVFVIKHNKSSGAYRWFTECCERLAAKLRNERESTPTTCC